ncbi:MAG: amino acid adenylation domain-containing protein [Rubrivivax sp.]|nr:amino acid adenylation domain-containing protein [Rubrivivax sp.]
MTRAAALDDLLRQLAALDIRLALDGDRLNVNAPKGTLTAELRAELAAHKEALKESLKDGRAGAAGAALPSSAPATAALPELRAVPRQPRMPLSHTQQRLWFLRQMDPGSSNYNVVSLFRIRGPLDTAALAAAMDDLVRRHETLRTHFEAAEGSPYCVVHPPEQVRAPIQQLDLEAAPAAERQERAMHALMEDVAAPFDLARCPLLRLKLVRLQAEEHLLGIVVDHIVADGMSVGVFFAELQALYRQHQGGGAAALPPLPVQYLDVVQWQHEVQAAGAMSRHLDYWKQQLQGLPPVLALPIDRPRPRVQTHRGGRRMEIFPPALQGALKGLARREGVTLYMVLLAAYQVLLHRLSGEVDFAVGTAVGARDRPELQRVIGFFANNIVLRADIAGDPTVSELLHRVRDVATKAYAHQDMPFDLLVEALAPRRELDHSPLFQVLFVLHNLMVDRFELGAAVCSAVEPRHRTSRFDLAVDIFDLGEGLRTYFEYNADLFDEPTIERLMGHYRSLLEGMLADPGQRVSTLPLVGATSGTGAAALALQCGPALETPEVATAHGLFETQLRRSPHAEAVVFGTQCLSYEALDQRANRLAHELIARGVTPDALVGVYMERGIELAVALLAVLKAGAAYVPLDPAFPKERIEFMLGDAAVAALVTHAALGDALARGDSLARGALAHVPQLALDRDAAAIAARPATPPACAVSGSDLAYVIYTSGSTGRPKGVMIEHAAVVNFLRSMHHEPGIAAGDRWVSVTTLSFDIFGLELWGPLSAGGTVVLASRATALDGRALSDLLQEQRATVLQATPATWRLLIEAGWSGLPGLKMLCGGEALPRDLAGRLLQLGGELWNMYGPTETTIWSTLTRITDAAEPITIGRPIAGTSVAILEASGQLAVPGVAGELCIGGAGVARGYHQRPELTAEKFATLSLAGGAPERWYRTGDLARLRSDGRLEFIGRRDNQIKLRGYRIELGEIEAALAAAPGVQQAVVVVREDVPGDQRLVAYVVARDGFAADAVRTALRARLPEYMVPNHVVALGALPLTPNGKIDRKALPAPAPEAPADAGPPVVMGPAEQRVADAWRELLGLPRVGLQDNFFDLGGHSLLLVRLQARLQREFERELPLVELFQYPTVQAQARRLAGTRELEGSNRAFGPDGQHGESGQPPSALQRARARAEELQRRSRPHEPTSAR